MKSYLLLIITTLLLSSSCAKLGLSKIDRKKTSFRVLWAKNFDRNFETGNLPIALNSPLIHEGIVYVGSDDGYMNAYQLNDGRKIWSHKEKGNFHASPIVHDDILVFGTNQGRVVAREALSGKTIYKVDLDASIESSGVIYKGRLFFQTRNHKIFCLDMLTGKILWSYKRSVPFLTTLQRVSSPLVKNGKVYIGFADGYMVSFSVEDGVVIWEQKISDGSKFIDVDLSPIIYKDKLVSSSMDGGLVTLDPRTGQLLRKLKYNIARTPIEYKGNLLIGTMKGELIELDPYFSEVNKTVVSKVGISSMKLWKEKLVMSTFGHNIYHVDLTSFKSVENFSLGSYYSAVFGDMNSKGDYLAVLSSRNHLYIFK